MTFHEDPSVRSNALQIILLCRQKKFSEDSKNIGKINFNVEIWIDFVVMDNLASSDESLLARHFFCEYLGSIKDWSPAITISFTKRGKICKIGFEGFRAYIWGGQQTCFDQVYDPKSSNAS